MCWDYKTPHANSRLNTLLTAREVVYIGLLPDVPINKNYALQQLERYRKGELPSDQWHASDVKEVKVALQNE